MIPNQWASETRTTSLDTRLTEKNYEFTYTLKPGASVWHAQAVPQQYLLRATHGAVVEGAASQQVLARCTLSVRDEWQVFRELRLDLITVHDQVLQAQVNRMERILTHLVSVADGKTSSQIDDSNLREALSRLGYKPTARDLREFSPAIVLQTQSRFEVKVDVDDDCDFEPFTWRLTVHGAHTNR